LYASACEGWLEMAEKLLSLGANPNGNDYSFKKPLQAACREGHLNVVRALLHHGAETREVMAEAASNGHTEIVRLLLQHGAETAGALSLAAKRGYMDIVRLLLQHGVDPNGE
ncbi:ankyrin repeat protein, partial [Westerdykella ornata]